MTTEPGERPDPAPRGVAAALAVPADHPPFVRDFLDRWRPDACVWIDGTLRPALMDAALARMPVVVAGARVETQPGWALGIPAALLGRAHRVMALDARDAQAWRRLGAPAGRVEITGPLQVCAEPPRDDEATRRALTTRLAGRAAWFAPAVPPALAPMVIEAHRHVLRRAHRALLAIEPAGPGPIDLDPTHTAMQTGAAPGACAPEEVHDTVVLDDPGLRGLWYRLAPVTLLGETLEPDPATVDPDGPAALGSAIVHGPHHGPHARGFARLVSEGASLEIERAEDAAAAVEALLSPDRAARQAHAAWAVVTRGAEATDRLAEMLLHAIDG